MMRCLCALLFSTAAACIVEAQTTASAGNACDSVYSAFTKSLDIAAAVDGYLTCLPQSPMTARYNLGVFYAGMQEWSRAVEQFEAYLAVDAKSARAATVKAELARLAEMRERYDTPEKVRQLRHDLVLRQSRLFLRVGMNDDAEVLAERAVQFSGGTYDDYIALAAATVAKKNFDVAMRQLDRSRPMVPADKSAALAELRARVNKELTIATLRQSAESSLRSDPRRSAELFVAAGKLAPEREDLVFAAAIAYIGTDVPQLAIPVLDTLANGKDSDLATRAGKLGADLRRLVTAIDNKRVNDAQALSKMLAGTGKKKWTDLSSRDFARVERALTEMVRRDASNLSFRHHYAFVLARRQKWPEAEIQYKEILRRDSDTPVHFWLARVLYKERKYEECQRLLNEDLRRAEYATPADADLKRYLAEDVGDAIKKLKP